MTLDQYLAKRVQTLRKEYHLTQEQLAEAANLDVSSIAKIERGERSNIKINTLEKIVDAFELPITAFFQDANDTKEDISPLIQKLGTLLLTLPKEKQYEYLTIFEAIIKASR